jgi:hypothetical protein
MKTKIYLKIFLLILLALLFGMLLKPIVVFLSGIISFGMGLAIAYLVISYLEDKWKWLN